ncbi:MAG: prenyltransferase [Candidatus Symbiothrix sp.]|jgi:1,4-dihydroxy-2-naphthoate octaprenyltransferase|nr:prenyltransferase [Candidatus Symbiothrix sp.]
MNTLRFWFRNARTKALPQSILPAVLALCMASMEAGFSIYLGLSALLGVIAGHLGMNLFDDYFDYKVKSSEFRDKMARKGFRARISKCAYITSGATDLKHLLFACLAFSAAAVILGIVIWWYRGNVIFYLALITAVLGISYSGAPLRLSYRGLGEILIGLMFGPLLMIGVFYAACGVFGWPVVFVSVPIGLLVANIVYTHSIMDFEPDKEVGKMTFAVLLKDKNRMLACLLLLLLMAFGCIIGGVIAGYLSAYYLLSLLTLPMAVSLFYLMIEFVRKPEKQFVPRWWMGPMSNWQNIRAAGIDWFMIRWFSARNLLSFFCLIIIVVNIILMLW